MKNPPRRRSFRRRRSSRRSRRTFLGFRNPPKRSRRSGGGGGRGLFDSETLTLLGGVLLGSVGVNYAVSSLTNYAVNNQSSIPGTATRAGSIAWKAILGGGIGWLLYAKTAQKTLGKGIVVGTAVSIASDLVAGTALGSTSPYTGAYLGRPGFGARRFRRRGTSAWIPGVNPIFTGPASSYLPMAARRPGVGGPGFRSSIPLPMPRPGVGANIGRNFVSRAVGYGKNPFKS